MTVVAINSLGTLAGQRPPLSCRTSPPRGGRSAVWALRSILQHRQLAKAAITADLPLVGEMSGRTEGGVKDRGAQLFRWPAND